MKACFTICANNYLASAKVLKESFNTYHPGIPFFIVLVDRPDALLNYKDFNNDSIMFIDDIVDLNIHQLSNRFNISELCTVVKPFIFSYLFKQYDQIVFLDPDIKVYAPLAACWDALDTFNFVLTPHLMTPIDDDQTPTDFITLRTGIFNLGFIGLTLNNEVERFLLWWGERLLKYGYSRWDEGMFYDQIWANYIPVMFNNYYILKHYGYNVSNWNWHERYLKKSNGHWVINGEYELVFFHFSSYKYTDPDVLCRYNTRFSKENRPDLVPVFAEYHNDLTNAGAKITGALKAHYQENFINCLRKSYADEKITKKIKRRVINYLK